MNPRVAHVHANDDHTLTLTFVDGQQRRFDVKPYLDRGMFRELARLEYFRRAMVVEGTVVWPNEQDFCPDTLFLDGIPLPVAAAAH